MRRFTPREANAMLPQLRRDLSRIQELIAIARKLHREQELCKAVGYNEDGSLIMLVDYQAARDGINQAVKEADHIIEEIHRQGVILKDVERGLVDFPAQMEGEDVLLCWELGEEAVEHFHDYVSGYRGRQAIPPEWR